MLPYSAGGIFVSLCSLLTCVRNEEFILTFIYRICSHSELRTIASLYDFKDEPDTDVEVFNYCVNSLGHKGANSKILLIEYSLTVGRSSHLLIRSRWWTLQLVQCSVGRSTVRRFFNAETTITLVITCTLSFPSCCETYFKFLKSISKIRFTMWLCKGS